MRSPRLPGVRSATVSMVGLLRLRWLPALALLIEALVFHRRVLFSQAWTIPWDFRDYHLPLAEFMARSLREGRLPLWDPYTYCGVPFYANVQAQFAYPPAWLAILVSNLAGGRRLLEFLEWQLVLHVFLAGWFAYLLFRRLGAGRAAATFGGTVFQLGGYFASQAQHLGAICGAAWLPLAWASVVDLGNAFRWRRLAVLAVALAMSVLAGFPAVTIVVFLTAFLLACTLALWRRVPLRLPLEVVAAALWGATLAGVQLLPAMEAARLSTAYSRGEFAGTGGGVPWVGLLSLVAPHHNHIFDLSQYRLPWNPTFLYLYSSFAGLLCALAGAAARTPYRLPLLAVTGAAAIWMLGESTPVARTIFVALPTWAKSPLYAEFAMPAFLLGLAALAALGAERLTAGRAAWLRSALVAVAAADLTLAGANRNMNAVRVADEPAATVAQFEGSAETLARMRELVNRSFPPARVESYRDSMRWANSAPMTGIPTASGNDPLAPARILAVRKLFGRGQPWLRYWELDDLDSPLPGLLNVRYLVTYAPTAEPALEHPQWRRAADLPGHQVYENLRVLPRFFLVSRIHAARDQKQALAMLSAPGFDPAREAVLEGAPGRELPGAGPARVRVVKYEDRELLLETEAASDAFLVSSETWYPGWRAWVDGREVQLYLTNAAFRGLFVPAGRHRIRMRFEPGVFRWGTGLSTLACAGCIAALIRRRSTAGYGADGGKENRGGTDG
ncbi:MAG: YfhO family protein [Bryobacterales bacterium]|nr:YfhO family protein [Bryobacteraceae bacterium]MDW8131370.1 YfhO family protein [Bryobacterales bacterium]